MSEKKIELYKSIALVMKDVENIDKSMTVGKGGNAYKAVSDKDVKLAVRKAMQEYGLIMLPKDYETTLNIERWEEVDPWSKSTPKDVKTKQSVFVEAKCVYELIHVDTGQSVEIPAYGHGIDPQDKAAGKATTYALKTALLYAFLIPTGAVDDTDTEHSNDKEIPQKPQPKTKPKAPTKPKPREDGMLVIPSKADIDAAIYHKMPIEEVVSVFKMNNDQCERYEKLLKSKK